MPELPTPPSWNLSDLYSGLDDPRLEADLASTLERAKQFESTYRDRIDQLDLSPDTLLAALQEIEAIQRDSAKPAAFASLSYYADTSDPQLGALYGRVREAHSQLSIHLIFFELALLKLPEEQAQTLMERPELAPYRHFIQTTRAYAGHDLSEPEERILEEKANTSGRAFSRLFQEVTSNTTYKVEEGGEKKTMTQPEVLSLLFRPEREIRKEAARSFSEGLKEQNRILTFIFNTMLQDKATEDRLRHYDEPEDSRHLSNELDAETVETVMRTCEEHFDLVSRFYNVKRDILGYETLTHYDRYAPLFDAQEEVSFPQAREIVLDAFQSFSPAMHAATEEFFDRGWIDAAIRPGKRGGAFCSSVTPDLHPYVFLNYLNRMSDVMTLAHELGHGVHGSLARAQSYLNFHGTLPLAELASTFAEMLVFEKLLAAAGPQDQLALYAHKIEDSFATIFRQASMFRFEQKLHRARREQGELTAEGIGDIWHAQIQTMFGDSVELGEEHRIWWSYIPHFISTPFYVYAYSFGELLVMALYRMYQQEGSAFSEKYLNLLQQGGSKSPQELMGQMGIDLRSAEFWRGGMEVLGGLVSRFEELYRQSKR